MRGVAHLPYMEYESPWFFQCGTLNFSNRFYRRTTLSWRYNVIMVVVDLLSKYSYFLTLKHPKQVASIFMERVVSKHGISKSIITNSYKIFFTNFLRELFTTKGTLLKRSTAFHPQTDGKTERVNKCQETYLRCFCNEQPRKWDKSIPWAKLWYNTTFHTSTKVTPFQTVYGRPPIIIVWDE